MASIRPNSVQNAALLLLKRGTRWESGRDPNPIPTVQLTTPTFPRGVGACIRPPRPWRFLRPPRGLKNIAAIHIIYSYILCTCIHTHMTFLLCNHILLTVDCLTHPCQNSQAGRPCALIFLGPGDVERHHRHAAHRKGRNEDGFGHIVSRGSPGNSSRLGPALYSVLKGEPSSRFDGGQSTPSPGLS